jgi:release factor glutamine methyltransferase
MTARELAFEIRTLLEQAGVPDAAFEAELLVRRAAALTRSRFFLDPELPAAAIERARAAARRRERREPAAYIAGEREFFGLRFELTPDVLIPRPESELLVDIARREAVTMSPTPVIVDVGTGSGAIAVACRLVIPGAYVVATDVSEAALRVARRNAAMHSIRIVAVLGSLVSGLRQADIVLANLPYIPGREIDQLEPEVSRWEPRLALDGGSDGLVLIRSLIDDCARRLRPRVLALEVGYGMASAVAAHAAGTGARTSNERDPAGIERVVCCRWP